MYIIIAKHFFTSYVSLDPQQKATGFVYGWLEVVAVAAAAASLTETQTDLVNIQKEGRGEGEAGPLLWTYTILYIKGRKQGRLCQLYIASYMYIVL